jgi:hypothetical protein
MNTLMPFAFFAVFGVVGLVMLFRPSAYLGMKSVRDTYNPKLLASPMFRINLRVLGLLFCLFILMPASQAAAGFTGSQFLAAFSKTLFQVLVVIFFVIWFGYVFDWIAGKLRIIKPTLKERFDQMSPAQDASLQRKEPRIAGLVLVGVLLLTVLLTWIRI